MHDDPTIDEGGFTTTPDEQASTPQADERSSVLDGLRAKLDQQGKGRDEERLTRPIGGVFGDDLVAVYRYVPLDKAQKRGARLSNLPEEVRAYYSAVDTLILACSEIKFRMPDGEYRPLAADGEPAVNFETYKTLAANLGFEDEAKAPGYSGRAAVLKLFGSEYAIIAEAERVSEWMRDFKKRADEHFLSS